MTPNGITNTAYPHAELTGKIIKCCMEAHNFLGPGLPEITYHKIVEFKALAGLTDDHISQVLTYLKVTNVQIGLLINFGEQKLVMRRLINKHFDPTLPANLIP